MTLVNLWLPFLIVLLILFVFFRNTGIEDPINREFIQPVAGLIYMLFGSDTELDIGFRLLYCFNLNTLPNLNNIFCNPKSYTIQKHKKRKRKSFDNFRIVWIIV